MSLPFMPYDFITAESPSCQTEENCLQRIISPCCYMLCELYDAKLSVTVINWDNLIFTEISVLVSDISFVFYVLCDSMLIGIALVSVSVVNLRWSWLVLGWVTICWRMNLLGRFGSARLTQPSHPFVNRCSEYQWKLWVDRHTVQCTSLVSVIL